jgi:hypothetical protein
MKDGRQAHRCGYAVTVGNSRGPRGAFGKIVAAINP